MPSLSSSLRRAAFVLACLLVGYVSSIVIERPVLAQLSYTPPSFAPKQTIGSATFNTLFNVIDQEALNRTNGIMVGNLTWSTDGAGSIGASGANRPGDIHVADDVFIGDALTVSGAASFAATLSVTGASTFAGISATTGTFSSTLSVTGAATLSSTLGVTGAATLSSTLAVNSTSASAIDVAGGITAGSGNVGIIGTDGRIPAISSTTFASLSGANLTGIPESAITDGTTLARVASAETITASWTFNDGPSVANTQSWGAHNTAGEIAVLGFDGTNTLNIGPSDALVDAGCCNTTVLRGNGLVFQTDNTTRTTIDATTGTLTHNFALRLTSVISPAALPNSTAQNYNPAGLATAHVVRVASGGASSALGGLTALAAGTRIQICEVGGSSSLAISGEDAGSTAANRFSRAATISNLGCLEFWYDGTSSRWRPIGIL